MAFDEFFHDVPRLLVVFGSHFLKYLYPFTKHQHINSGYNPANHL